jgi:Sulfotransferase domain
MTFCHPELVTSPTATACCRRRGARPWTPRTISPPCSVHRFSCIIVSFLLVRIDGQEGPSLASRTGSPGYGGTVFRDFYLAEPEDRGRATKGFEEHVREVKERVPPERLLVYEVREGWGPLCAFLGVEAPQGERFPHLNEGEQFPRLMRRAVLSELAPGWARPRPPWRSAPPELRFMQPTT